MIVPEGQDDALYSCLADFMTTEYSARCVMANSRYELLREHLTDIFGRFILTKKYKREEQCDQVYITSK